MHFPPSSQEGPPPGYDDNTIIPKERLKVLTNDFEHEITLFEDYLKAGLPGQYQPNKNVKLLLNSMNYAAKELGDIYLEHVEELIHAYHNFEADPCLKKATEIHILVKKLKLALSI